MPRRIVSLAPGATETLVALGLGDEIAGVSPWCDARSVEGLPRVGTPAGGIVPIRVLDLKPDLVLAGGPDEGAHGRALGQLRGAGVDVHVLHPVEVAGVLQDMLKVGLLTDRVREASEVIGRTRAQLEKAFDRVPEAAAKPRVFVEVQGTPLTTVSEGVWVHDLVNSCGGANVFAAAKAGFPEVAAEDVLRCDPEVILAAWRGARGHAPTASAVVARPGWASLRAAKTGRVHVVDDGLLLRPGPRVGDAAEALVDLLHPPRWAP